MIHNKPFIYFVSVGNVYHKLYVEIIDQDESCFEVIVSETIGDWIKQQPGYEWNLIEDMSNDTSKIKKFIITKELYTMLLLRWE